MSPIFEKELIGPLMRIDDDDAAGLVSEQAFVELEEAILAIPPAPVRRRRDHRTVRRGVRRPLLAVAATAAVAAVVLGVSGLVSGGGPR